jgi:hypothetical protein
MLGSDADPQLCCDCEGNAWAEGNAQKRMTRLNYHLNPAAARTLERRWRPARNATHFVECATGEGRRLAASQSFNGCCSLRKRYRTPTLMEREAQTNKAEQHHCPGGRLGDRGREREDLGEKRVADDVVSYVRWMCIEVVEVLVGIRTRRRPSTRACRIGDAIFCWIIDDVIEERAPITYAEYGVWKLGPKLGHKGYKTRIEVVGAVGKRGDA